jgi:hypothetical protein
MTVAADGSNKRQSLYILAVKYTTSNHQIRLKYETNTCTPILHKSSNNFNLLCKYFSITNALLIKDLYADFILPATKGPIL